MPDAAALAAISQTAKGFVELYRNGKGEFPSTSREAAYEDRIKRSYPIHPELFDTLYEEWSSLERFQRTRGVLRLMSTVIHALWEGGDMSPLIMPASIPLAHQKVNPELVQYLPDQWKGVIDADVDGPNSEPTQIDKERPTFGQRSLTKRLARTVFFGAAPTIGSSHKGIETQRVWARTRGFAVPSWRNPAEVPVLHWLHSWSWLTPDGWVPLTQAELWLQAATWLAGRLECLVAELGARLGGALVATVEQRERGVLRTVAWHAGR